MSNCPSCGAPIPEGAKFCMKCGSKIEDVIESANGSEPEPAPEAEPEPAPEAEPEPAPEAEPEPVAPGIINKFKGNKPLLIGAIVVLVAIVIAIGFAVHEAQNPIRIDQLRGDVKSNYGNGVVNSSYIDDSDYEIVSCEITGESKQPDQELFGTTLEIVNVDFSTEVKNENFDSHVTGTMQYVREKGSSSDYECIGTTNVDHTTTPLKGVDSMDESGLGLTTYSDVPIEPSNFSSDFTDSGDGTFTSVATEDLTQTAWFKTQTFNVKETFVFDESTGWTLKGEPESTPADPDFTIVGKTFAWSGSSGAWLRNGSLSATMTFKDIKRDGNDWVATVDYKLDWSPNKDVNWFISDPVSISGTATGVFKTDPGDPNFEVELNDSEHGVTLDCSNGTPETVAGVGTVNTVSTQVYTKTNVSADSGEYLICTSHSVEFLEAR